MEVITTITAIAAMSVRGIWLCVVEGRRAVEGLCAVEERRGGVPWKGCGRRRNGGAAGWRAACLGLIGSPARSWGYFTLYSVAGGGLIVKAQSLDRW